MKTEKETKEEMCKHACRKGKGRSGSSGAFYCMGLIGAAIYFIQHATSFMDGVVGILKAVVWPAFVAYKFFELFKF
jgi:hypothetical protein